ncbi:MAG TPA: sulfotransferase [Steroidobacteraceae bacterium]|nr:sulfotransferase [Steroidobacteraceae bacterium]
MPTIESVAGRAAQQADSWTGPLFIIGMPRSGTKLLRGLLEQHPRVRVPRAETEFFPFLLRWVQRHGQPEQPDAFAALFAQLQTAPYFQWRAPEQRPFEWREWREYCSGRYDAAGLFEGFVRYETGAAAHTGLIWGDKSPAYMRHFATLLEHFPSARVVHIVRDVRDHCVSMRNAWHKDIRRAAFRWGRDVGHAHRICQQHRARCLELKYEDLLQAPHVHMRRLSDFLQIDFSEAMTRLERPVERRGYAAGHAEVVSGNRQKFAERLTRREIRAVESLAWDTMRLLGYQPLYAQRQRQLNAFEQRVLRLKDGIQLLVHDGRKSGFASALRFHWQHTRVVD